MIGADIASVARTPSVERAGTIVRVRFGETPAALHGWLGKPLEVGVVTAEREPVMVANMEGEPTLGSDLSVAAQENGAVYFQLSGGGANGLLLRPDSFGGAHWYDGGRTVLACRCGRLGC